MKTKTLCPPRVWLSVSLGLCAPNRPNSLAYEKTQHFLLLEASSFASLILLYASVCLNCSKVIASLRCSSRLRYVSSSSMLSAQAIRLASHWLWNWRSLAHRLTASTILYNSPNAPVLSLSKNNARTSPLRPLRLGSATRLVAIASACCGVIFTLALVYWLRLHSLDAIITSAVPGPNVEFITANVGEPPIMASYSLACKGASAP